MKPPCEIIAQEILPAVRAMIAVNLLKTYGLSQKEVAERMGTTQPAVSQYKREIRGYKTLFIRRNPELLNMVQGLSKKLAYKKIPVEELTFEFCKICIEIRKKGLLCEIHKKNSPELENCDLCLREFKF